MTDSAPTGERPAGTNTDLTRRYAQAIRVGDEDAAGAVIEEALASGVEASRVMAQILTPAMREIGDHWELGDIGIADEHLATAITERMLALIYPALFHASPLTRERVLVSGVEGEQHVLGLRMVADILEGHGYEVLFLGADVHVSMLLAAIARFQPAAIALGSTGQWSQPALMHAIEKLKAHPEIPIILGGAGVPLTIPTDGATVIRVPEADQVPHAIAKALA